MGKEIDKLRSPAPRQQNKSAFGLGMFDHHEIHSIALRLTLRRFARVSLIDKRDVHRTARHFLYGLHKLGYLFAVLLICLRDVKRQQIP